MIISSFFEKKSKKNCKKTKKGLLFLKTQVIMYNDGVSFFREDCEAYDIVVRKNPEFCFRNRGMKRCAEGDFSENVFVHKT